MRTPRIYSIGLAVMIVAAVSQASYGQLGNFYTSPGWVSTIAVIQENQIVKNALGIKKSGQSTSRSTSSASRTGPEIVPEYRRYPSVQFRSTGTRLALQEYLDQVKIGPQAKAELKEMILDNFRRYEAEAASKGLPNDWALAFVSYIGINSHIYYGRTDKLALPFEQNVGIRDVVAELVTDRGVFRDVADREKQELYELLVMLGGITYHYYEKAVRENNADDIRDVKMLAANNLRLVGVTP